MTDPWGSFQNFMNNFNQLVSNPTQYVMNHLGVSQEMARHPEQLIQSMMQNGQLSQFQYNAARRFAMQIQNNPLFRQLINTPH